MGLDISFNREQAVAAGLVIHQLPNGNGETILRTKGFHAEESWYLKYLQQLGNYVEVPGLGQLVEDYGFSTIVIRANKWGPVYEPMTTWLTKHNITWSEF